MSAYSFYYSSEKIIVFAWNSYTAPTEIVESMFALMALRTCSFEALNS